MTCKHLKGADDCTSTVGGSAWREQQDYYAQQAAKSRTPEQIAADNRAEADKIRNEARRLYDAAAHLDGRLGATPDAADYEVTDVVQVGPHLVLRVRYPSCAACSYEGHKVLVILDATPVQAIKWRRIDPHFRDPTRAATSDTREAPSPAARFPASDAGWADALEYARSKSKTT